MKCSIQGCGRVAKSRGWCPAHYMRWRKYGDTGSAELKTWHQVSDDIRNMHDRLRRARGKASTYVCSCGKQAMDWAYNHGDPAPKLSKDKRGTWMWWSSDPDMYVPMCRRCHKNLDVKMAAAELAEYRQMKYQAQQRGVEQLGSSPAS